MLKALIVIDVMNFYHCLKDKFSGGRFDYKRFIEKLSETYTIYRAIAYGSYINYESVPFQDALSAAGYELRFKKVREYQDGNRKANWDIGLTIDAVKMLDWVDIVILGSADGDFAPLVEYIQSKGKRCLIYGSTISENLRIADKCFEIDPSYLEIKS